METVSIQMANCLFFYIFLNGGLENRKTMLFNSLYSVSCVFLSVKLSLFEQFIGSMMQRLSKDMCGVALAFKVLGE